VGVATSIIVFAVGAILRFATTVHSTSFNVHTVGVILMIVGAVGFVISLIFWASWGGFGSWHRSRTVYRQSAGTTYGQQPGTYVQPGADIVEERHESRF
jgi:hypothetical protein